MGIIPIDIIYINNKYITMDEEIEQLLEELSCIAYTYDRTNLIHKVTSFSGDNHLMYKELILITSKLDSLNINYKIDINSNILLSF